MLFTSLKPVFFLAVVASFILSMGIQLEAQTTATDPATLSQELGHGLNLGNILEVPRGENWGVTLHDKYFEIIAKAGFTLIRVPISWPEHASQLAPYTIEPDFFKQVDDVISQAKAHHLRVILDFHNFNGFAKDPARHEERFLALWKQIAEHYQSESPDVLFELLNEPADKFDAATWNQTLVKALAVVRASNPTRLVVVGGIHWNGIKALNDLVLPEDDRNLVVTFHYYNPMQFTHQGASWIEGSTPWLGTTWTGTEKEKQKVDQDMDMAAAWGKTHQRPIFMGEFGSYDKAPMDSRVIWTGYVTHAAEARGFAWTYWEFCSSFGAYDPKANQWRAPLLQALAPNAKP